MKNPLPKTLKATRADVSIDLVPITVRSREGSAKSNSGVVYPGISDEIKADDLYMFIGEELAANMLRNSANQILVRLWKSANATDKEGAAMLEDEQIIAQYLKSVADMSARGESIKKYQDRLLELATSDLSDPAVLIEMAEVSKKIKELKAANAK